MIYPINIYLIDKFKIIESEMRRKISENVSFNRIYPRVDRELLLVEEKY